MTGARTTRAVRCVAPTNAMDTVVRREAACVALVVVVTAVVDTDVRG